MEISSGIQSRNHSGPKRPQIRRKWPNYEHWVFLKQSHATQTISGIKRLKSFTLSYCKYHIGRNAPYPWSSFLNMFWILRWIHTIAFGPTFASVLQVTKMRPNVGENTFRGRKNVVHIVSVWSTSLASVGERWWTLASVWQRSMNFTWTNANFC